jgi:hypothetical protein
LRTLAFALTNRSHSLASACSAFDVKQGKQKVDEHGVITPAYIDYNRQEVRATGSLLEKLITAYRQHPIALPPTKAYSPASIAKAYLKVMGIRPPLERQPNFPRELLGAAMVAFYGGRAECRIRCTPVPVVYVDFLSMYPTVNTLMGLWQYLTAEQIESHDVTDQVRKLVRDVTVDDCFDPAFWPQLLTLVQIDPDGEILPTRPDYGEDGSGRSGSTRSAPTPRSGTRSPTLSPPPSAQGDRRRSCAPFSSPQSGCRRACSRSVWPGRSRSIPAATTSSPP